jgi:hypothetical protein
MTDEEMVGRVFSLAANVDKWEREANKDALSNKETLERRIAWDVLALCGAYDRHAAEMAKKRKGGHG